MIPIRKYHLTSLDILRALTMALMIFVNEFWSLTNIPLWLEHTQADVDGMGLSDVVFPAFLFIVGMSIPFAIENRRHKGEGKFNIVKHIMLRSFALLVMGVFLVNGESLNEEATGLLRVVWNSLCCISFILIWNAYPKTMNRTSIRVLKILGAAILITLAILCRTNGDEHFSPQWWGILGLIGWAYLVGAFIFTISKGNFAVVVMAWLVFLLLNATSHAEMIPPGSIGSFLLSPLGGGSMPALVLGGSVTSMVVTYYQKKEAPMKMMGVLLILAVLLFLVGIYTRTFWGISKIRATPAWVLICSSITLASFVMVYWLTELKNKSNWFSIIKPAGSQTLLCYLLPYFAYAAVTLTGFSLPVILLTGGIGLVKAAVFSLLIISLAGWMSKRGVTLKL